jgi:rhomboid protease GluP
LNDSPQPPNAERPPERIQVSGPKRKPIVTYVLIGLSVLIHLAVFMAGNKDLFELGKKINEKIIQGEYWRLITPILLHGSNLHLLFNMYALYIIGRRVEVFYGHGRFLLLYLLAGFAGNVFSFALTDATSVGSSTALFGLFAAEGVFIYQNRKLFGKIPTQQALINLGIVFVINLVYGFMNSDYIDNMGHIGEAIGGLFFAWKAGPLLRVSGQPPLLKLVDQRKKWEVLVASLVVVIGFTVIALIPFFAG